MILLGRVYGNVRVYVTGGSSFGRGKRTQLRISVKAITIRRFDEEYDGYCLRHVIKP